MEKNVAKLEQINDLPFMGLTRREWEVLLWLSDDLSTQEISEKLFISQKSAQNYKNRISSKLDINGRERLAKFARTHRNEIKRLYLIYKKYP